MNIMVRHMVRLPVHGLTIDRYRLSMVIDFASQITLSVALDDRKSLVFRPFWQISARIGGTVAAPRAAHGGPGIRL